MKTRWLLFFLLLLLWTAPARAEFALGVASSNVLLRSEADALRLSAYLEERVGEAVTVRVLADERGLHRWMSRFRQVDLGVLGTKYLLGQPTGEFHRLASIAGASRPSQIVMRQGLPSARVEAVKAILLSMADEPEGAALLSSLGGLRFLPAPAEPGASRRKPTVPPRKKTVTRKAAPTPTPRRDTVARTVAPAPVPAPTSTVETAEKVTFGVTAVNSLVSSEAEARKLGSYLAARLDKTVVIRVFEDSKTLFEELDLWRRIDLALLDVDYSRAPARSELLRLAGILGDGMPAPEEIVAGPSVGRVGAERARRILLAMEDDPEGRALLAELGKVRFVTPAAELENPEPRIPARRNSVEAPPSRAIPEEGVRAEMEGRWDDALFAYRKAMVKNPERRDLWWRIADIQSLLGRPHDTAMSILWMLKNRPNDASLYYRLALAQLGNGQFKAALEACSQAVILAPGNMEYLRTRAQLALWADDPETARESYLSILARDWTPSGN